MGALELAGKLFEPDVLYIGLNGGGGGLIVVKGKLRLAALIKNGFWNTACSFKSLLDLRFSTACKILS